MYKVSGCYAERDQRDERQKKDKQRSFSSSQPFFHLPFTVLLPIYSDWTQTPRTGYLTRFITLNTVTSFLFISGRKCHGIQYEGTGTRLSWSQVFL